jgi:hypothetical protein
VVHYFLLGSPIDRFLYRFARHRAGRGATVIPLKDLHQRSGSPRGLNRLRGYIRDLPAGRILEYEFTLKRSRRQENVHVRRVLDTGEGPPADESPVLRAHQSS